MYCVDKHETAWHMSIVFRERQPVALLTLIKFFEGGDTKEGGDRQGGWQTRGVADEGGGR